VTRPGLRGFPAGAGSTRFPGDRMEARKPDILMIDLPTPMKDSVMFGPEWTYEALMPAASYPSTSQIPRAELIDIHNG
jgi:hypothetical protein